MKKAFLLLAVSVVVLIVLDHHRDHAHDEDTYLEQLEHRLACATWVQYCDPTYGYVLRRPSCFVPAPVPDDTLEGRVRFAYAEEVSPLRTVNYIVQEATTLPCQDTLNPYREIRRLASDMGAVSLRQSADCYLMSGTLESNDPHVTAYRYSAKYVLRQRLWFVQTLIYPEDFAPAVHRLVREVQDWRPFD